MKYAMLLVAFLRKYVPLMYTNLTDFSRSQMSNGGAAAPQQIPYILPLHARRLQNFTSPAPSTLSSLLSIARPSHLPYTYP